MREFTDTAGRKWTLNITVGAVKRVREETDVLLTGLFNDQCKLLAELSSDVIKLVDILWVLCREQAGSAGVTVDEFAEGLGGDALGEAGEALVRATADFFTSQGQRETLNKLVDHLAAAATEIVASAGQAMEKIDPHQLAQSYSEELMSTPASRASSPNREPLASCS